MNEAFPRRVRDFLLAQIDSIGLLEVLLTLAAEPQEVFTADQVSDRLRTSSMSAQLKLRQLHECKLAEALPDGQFRFARGAELAETVRAVSLAYRERRLSVVTLIYSR